MLWYGGCWLLLTLWLRFALPESIIGWERHQLFRFSAEYLTFFSHQPYPILLYIQAFFTQFYICPLLGAAVIGGLLTLGTGAGHRLTGRLWPGAVWVAFILPTVPYFNLLWILVWLILLGGAILINLKSLTKVGRLGLTASLAMIATFILHENIVLAVAFWTVVSGVQARSWRAAGLGLAAGITGTAVGFGLVFWQGYPFVYTLYLGEWTLIKNDLFSLSTFPAKFFTCPIFLSLWIYVSNVILITSPLSSLRLRHLAKNTIQKRNRHWKIWYYSVTSLLFSSLFITTAYLNLRYQMEDFFMVDRLAGKRLWHEITTVADHAFFQRTRLYSKYQRNPSTMRDYIRPVEFQDPLDEHYMAKILKISLLADRQATNQMFTYNGPFPYFPVLFSENILYSPASYFMSLYYTQNGLHAEALHILYDLVTSNRISTAVLEPLLWNSVVVGDYAPCRKFIRFFEQSLFHKDIARRYTAYLADTAALAAQPEIAAARLQLSASNHTVLAYYPDHNIHFHMQYEANNAAVYEYALALQMLYKNPAQMLVELPKIRRYYPTLPIHIQEAIMVSLPLDVSNNIPNDISQEIITRYGEFLQAYGLYQNGYLSFQKLRKGFEDTYWYYLYFNELKAIESTATNNGGQI